MSVTVKAILGNEKYYTEFTAGENKIITDEPLEKGGQNKGFNPLEILATSLASCTAATLRMYIDRKGWEIPKINVEVELENYPLTKNVIFIRKISYEGANLDEDQLKHLLSVAEACPVHKILHGSMEVNTSFIE
ncbi:OsmC family protein [Chryseobacterium manosquense]|uniref:OsmC family protein n=1 Tax=Chryseobacterium manosquense TaxID=2754694 RepID=A0A7H1DWY1_9FLAO|nr:OsmC family protein [Chryseobacterium manosquense]QNS41489.1 OsmC family protein [Chryseobacterium manosquense]